MGNRSKVIGVRGVSFVVMTIGGQSVLVNGRAAAQRSMTYSEGFQKLVFSNVAFVSSG